MDIQPMPPVPTPNPQPGKGSAYPKNDCKNTGHVKVSHTQKDKRHILERIEKQSLSLTQDQALKVIHQEGNITLHVDDGNIKITQQ
jgi:hypothetical protein